jgi:hypothetical protein
MNLFEREFSGHSIVEELVSGEFELDELLCDDHSRVIQLLRNEFHKLDLNDMPFYYFPFPHFPLTIAH